MIRIAAVGDVHYDCDSRNRLRPHFESLSERVDFLLIAGDLTQTGAVDEAQALADDLKDLSLPVLVVLGNHDYHRDRERDIVRVLQDAGVIVLEGEAATFEVRGQSVGIVGLKGFGGGFYGACVTEFGEPETKAFARHAHEQAGVLKLALSRLQTDFRFVLLHYAPIDSTLLGEKREIYPFLGSHLLAEVIDAEGADAAFHGHAHMGTEKGCTPGGIPVRNVAQMVIRHAFHIYSFEAPAELSKNREDVVGILRTGP